MANVEKTIVGGTEWCALPELGVPHVLTRMDSGAKRSSLFASSIRAFERWGERWVRFELRPLGADEPALAQAEAKVERQVTLRTAGGNAQRCYVIRTSLVLGARSWEMELTLRPCGARPHALALGRHALAGAFLVDPEARFLQGEVSQPHLARTRASMKMERSRRLRIGLLANNPRLHSNRRLIEEIERRGHIAQFLNVQHCHIQLDAHVPKAFLRGATPIADLDAIIPRLRPSMTLQGCALTRHFEAMGIFCLNSARSIAQSRDKLCALQLLQREGLDIPVTGFAHSTAETAHLLEILGGAPVIVKLLQGTQGRGVVLAETAGAAESVISALRSLDAPLLVQEFVKEAKGHDLRCLVIDGRVVAAMERRAGPGDFRANLHQGGTAVPVRLSPSERKLAIRAAQTLQLHVAGVDILRSARGPLILEVNSSPGLEGIERVTGKNIAGLMIDALEKQLGWSHRTNHSTIDELQAAPSNVVRWKRETA